jgi:2'-5' RNA ligase
MNLAEHSRRQRLFFALWPKAETREELAAMVLRLKPALSAHWIRPENLHITLAFLGEVETGKLDAVKAAAAEIVSPKLELTLDRIEYWRKPKVLCLVPTASCNTLQRLAENLGGQLRAADFKLEERPYLAHLTLARKASRMPENIVFEKPLVWRTESFVLVESRQDGMGSSYTPIYYWPLLSPSPHG